MLALGGVARGRSGFANDGDPNDVSILNEAETCGQPSERGCSALIPHGAVVLEKDIDSEWEDDDSSEVIPRMRDLQDFGLRMPSNKRRRVDPVDACQCLRELPLAAHESKMLDSRVIKKEGTSDWYALGGGEPQSRKPNIKRRKFEAASSAEETACKRRDRRRPLTQVLKCSVKLADAAHQRDYVRPSTALDGMACLRVHESMDRETASPRQHLEVDCCPKPQYGKGLQPASQMVEQQMHESLSIVDNSCTNFSSFQLPKCCDGKRMRTSSLIHFGTLDPLHVFGPASTCSFLSASAHTGSLSSVNVPSFEKPGCKSLANDYGLVCSKQGKGISGSESQSNPLVSHTSSFCAPSDRGLDEYSSALSKKLMDCSEASPPLPAADVKGNLIKSSRRLVQEGILSSSECAGEDEAESFQADGAKRKEGLDESGSCSIINYGLDGQKEGGRIGSKWRAKRRRNSRVPGSLRRKQGSLSRDADACVGAANQGQMKSNFNSGSRIIRASTLDALSRESIDCDEYKESLPGSFPSKGSGKERLSVKSNLRNRGMKSLEDLGHGRYSSSYTTCQQGLRWVDVPIQTQAVHEQDRASCVSLVRNLSIGRPIVGYAVIVERLEWRTQAGRKDTRGGGCRRLCSGRRTTRRIPKRPQSSNLVTNLGAMYTSSKPKPKFAPRRPGSYVQKTRALSSLVFGNTTKTKDKESIVQKVSEPPLVTCIPVHTIFSRIREALFKQPPQGLITPSDSVQA